MSNIKHYVITWSAHEDTPVLKVEIDHDVCTDEHLHQINTFFTDHQCRLDECEGNITETVLKMLAVECFPRQVSEGWNTYGLICEFNEGMEGWPPMDGTHGIKILRCDAPTIGWEDMEVREITP